MKQSKESGELDLPWGSAAYGKANGNLVPTQQETGEDQEAVEGNRPWHVSIWYLAALLAVVSVVALVAAFGFASPAHADEPLADKELQVERQIGCPI